MHSGKQKLLLKVNCESFLHTTQFFWIVLNNENNHLNFEINNYWFSIINWKLNCMQKRKTVYHMKDKTAKAKKSDQIILNLE